MLVAALCLFGLPSDDRGVKALGPLTRDAGAAVRPSGCPRTYTREMFHSAARSAYRRPVVPARKLVTVRRIVRCQRRDVSRRIVRRSLRRYRAKHARRFYWQLTFARLSPGDQSWAISTGACESGNDPTTNTGNGFLGAFQWVLSTWHAAGGSGSPVYASWHEQAVRAVRWRNIAGRGQWPVCG